MAHQSSCVFKERVRYIILLGVSSVVFKDKRTSKVDI